MDASEIIIGVAGMVTGITSALAVPWVTNKLTDRKRSRDSKYERLVLLRHSSRNALLAYKDTVSTLVASEFCEVRNIRLGFDVLDSTYTDMARSLSAKYPQLLHAFLAYEQRRQALDDTLHRIVRLSREMHRSASGVTAHSMDEWTNELEDGLAQLVEKRLALKDQLKVAAEDMGYAFVLDHEP